jgi:hypothetical protein
MIKLIDLLPKALFQEAKITPVGIGKILPEKDAKLVAKLAESAFDGFSDIDRDTPLSVDFDMNEYCDEDNYDIDDYDELILEPKCSILQKLFKKYPNGGKFVSTDVFGLYDPVHFAPGTLLTNKFTELIEIDPKYKIITLSVPPLSDETYNTGWFDRSGKYHPDTDNFDKDGNYIGNA